MHCMHKKEIGYCEVDLIIDTGEKVEPKEVKAEVNLKAKSLKTYHEKFAPKISVRTSMEDYKKEDWLINLRLYAIEKIMETVCHADIMTNEKRKENQ